MALKARLESLEGLSEQVAAEYVEQEDKTFLLNVEATGSMELSDTTGLKSALGKERAAAKAALEKLQKFADLDPKAAQEALAKVKEMADWNPEKEVAEKVKAREAQLIGRHEAEKAEMLKATKEMESQLEHNLITAVLTDAITAAGGSPKLLLPHLRQYVHMRKVDGGKYIAEVIDGEGNQRIGDSAGNPMLMTQLVEENKNDSDFAGGYKGTGSSGSGAGGTPAAGTTPPKPSGSKKVIALSDQDAMNSNVDGIAKGEVTVDWDK